MLGIDNLTVLHTDLKYWYLRNHKLFWVLNNQEVKQLCIITGFRQARKSDIIYLSDSEEPRIYFLKKGSIKIVDVDENGNEVLKEVLQKGDLFGELSLDPNTNNGEYAVALTNDVVVCSFLLKDFESIIYKHPGLGITYSKLVGIQLKRVRNSYSNLIFKDARSRLLSFLKEWMEKEGKEIEGKIIIKNYLTQNDIASIICTSRQTATQLLNALEEEGVIRYMRKEIEILNKVALH